MNTKHFTSSSDSCSHLVYQTNMLSNPEQIQHPTGYTTPHRCSSPQVLTICFCESVHSYSLPVHSLLTLLLHSLTFASSLCPKVGPSADPWQSTMLCIERHASAHLFTRWAFSTSPLQAIMNGAIGCEYRHRGSSWDYNCRVERYNVN